MPEAVEIVASQISRCAQIRQLQFIEQTQGKEFADKVMAKVKANGGVKKR